MLLDRDYPEGLVISAITRAKTISRSQALKPMVAHKQSRRPALVTFYDPRLPNIQSIQMKHWRSMTQDPYLHEVFPEPPLTAYKRQRNLKDRLVRAKVPKEKPNKPNRILKGMTKCGRQCTSCPYILEGKEIRATTWKWNITKRVDCSTTNCVYMIECQKQYCKEKYIGETERELRERISEHRGYIHNKVKSQATGAHFNLPGHSLSDMKVTILEKVKSKDDLYRKERESYHIRKFNTFYRGINRKP